MLAPSNGLSRDPLKRLRDYIETYLYDRLTLSDLAGVACLSPYHLTAPSRSRSALVRSAMSFSVGSSRRNFDSPDQSAPRRNRSTGRAVQPEPYDIHVPAGDRTHTWPIPSRPDMSLPATAISRHADRCRCRRDRGSFRDVLEKGRVQSPFGGPPSVTIQRLAE